MKKRISITAAVLLAALAALLCVACKSFVYGIDGVDIAQYEIVYADGDHGARTVAERLASDIEKTCGAALECVPAGNSNSKHKIVLERAESDDGKYAIGSDDGNVVLRAAELSGLAAASKRLVEDVKQGKISYTEPIADGYADLTLKAMSFNILTTAEERWDRLKNVITRNDPDILGTQEVSTYWQPKFRNELPGYTCVGQGRVDSGNEAGFILFKKDKFRLLEDGTRWYSDTPDVPSKVDGCTYTRIFTYAHLRRRSDKIEFVFVNTHFDLNQAARMRQVQMLTDFVSEKFGNDMPVYITGDFNTGVNDTYENGVWGTLPVDDYDANDFLSDNGYSDSRLVATSTDAHHTYPTTLRPQDDVWLDENGNGSIIDYCFVRGGIAVDSYKVDSLLPDNPNKLDGRGDDASDHYPVVATTVMF